MENNTICSYINSKDIRKYLADIDYKFSSLEAAWLVYQSKNLTLKEKHAAWQDIVATMPDCIVESGHLDKPIESLHRMLEDYISMQKTIFDIFFTNDVQEFHQYVLIYGDQSHENYDESVCFAEYNSCLTSMKREFCKDDNATLG